MPAIASRPLAFRPKAPNLKADPIIVHPDIRRALMTMRAFNEGGRAFALWTALQSDIAHRSDDAKARETAADLLGLMTPILKGVMTDKGFDHAVMAQQVYGGHGYIEEWGMSQYVRDARIAMIYEGANGIQALDLVGRKLPANGGRAVMALFNEVGAFCEENRSNEALSGFTKALKKGLNDLQASTMWFMQNAMAKPTMPAPVPTTTCTCSASSSSATCGPRWQRSPRMSLPLAILRAKTTLRTS